MSPTSINKDTIRPHTLSENTLAPEIPHNKYYLDDDQEIFSRIPRTPLFHDEEGLPYSIVQNGFIRSKSDDVVESYYTLDDKGTVRMGIPVFVQLDPKKSLISTTVYSHFEFDTVPENKCGMKKFDWNRDSWRKWMMTHGSLTPSRMLSNEDMSIMSQVRAGIPGTKDDDEQSKDIEGYIEGELETLFDLVIGPKLCSIPEVFDDGSQEPHRSNNSNTSIGNSDTSETHFHPLTWDSLFTEHSRVEF